MKAIFKLLNPDNTMSINRQLAHAIGLAEAVVYGALLSKYAYYDQHGLLTDGDWFYSTVEDLEESTALTARQQRRCIDTLIKSGLIQCKVQGMPAKRYFCINDDTELLAGILSNGSKSSCDKSAQLDGTVKQSEPVTNGITEPSSTSDGSAPVMTKAHNLFSPNVTTCSNEKEEQDLTKLPNCSIYKTKEILMQEGWHLQPLFVRIYEELGLDAAPLICYREEYQLRLQQEDEERERRNEEQRRQAEEQQRERLRQAGNRFLAGESISCEDFIGLCKLEQIPIPLRTHGTLSRSVIELSRNSIRHSHTKSGAKPKLDGCFAMVETLYGKLSETMDTKMK